MRTLPLVIVRWLLLLLGMMEMALAVRIEGKYPPLMFWAAAFTLLVYCFYGRSPSSGEANG